jgi:thiol-disulfide isomerase/thioredoxin
MNKKIVLLCFSISLLVNCQSKPKTTFSKLALEDSLIQPNDESITVQEILKQHSGKYVFIDVWASWCKDCRKALPDLEKLQKQFPKMSYVFFSLDRSKKAWKKAIKQYNIEGDHYYMSSGWKGPLGQFLDLDWIPRYMIIDPEGKILVYKAIETTDKNLLKHIQ